MPTITISHFLNKCLLYKPFRSTESSRPEIRQPTSTIVTSTTFERERTGYSCREHGRRRRRQLVKQRVHDLAE